MLKSSYPEIPTLTDTRIRSAKPEQRPVRLYDDQGAKDAGFVLFSGAKS
jgi:hypothetical protein